MGVDWFSDALEVAEIFFVVGGVLTAGFLCLEAVLATCRFDAAAVEYTNNLPSKWL